MFGSRSISVAQLEADKAEKAKLNIELDELRYQVQQLLKRLRAKGGAAFEALLEGDDFVAKIAGGLDNRDNVFNRLYNDALQRLVYPAGATKRQFDA